MTNKQLTSNPMCAICGEHANEHLGIPGHQFLSEDDVPSVLGAGGGSVPMPTIEEYRAAHKAEYVRLFVEVGVPEETAASWHDEQWDDIKDIPPKECFDDETSYWSEE